MTERLAAWGSERLQQALLTNQVAELTPRDGRLVTRDRHWSAGRVAFEDGPGDL